MANVYNNSMTMLPSEDYIAGFVDGEGCFALNLLPDRKFDSNRNLIREYFYWRAQFCIVLHPSDARILESIKEVLGVGKISFKRVGDQVRYSVQGLEDLHSVIVPFFERTPLLGMKGKDFSLWSQAIKILWRHRQSKTGREHPIDPATREVLEDLKRRIDEHKHKPSGRK